MLIYFIIKFSITVKEMKNLENVLIKRAEKYGIKINKNILLRRKRIGKYIAFKKN